MMMYISTLIAIFGIANTIDGIGLTYSYYKGSLTKINPATKIEEKYPAFFEVLSTERDRVTFKFKAIIVKDNNENTNSYEIYKSPRIFSQKNNFGIPKSALCEISENEKCEFHSF